MDGLLDIKVHSPSPALRIKVISLIQAIIIKGIRRTLVIIDCQPIPGIERSCARECLCIGNGHDFIDISNVEYCAIPQGDDLGNTNDCRHEQHPLHEFLFYRMRRREECD